MADALGQDLLPGLVEQPAGPLASDDRGLQPRDARFRSRFGDEPVRSNGRGLALEAQLGGRLDLDAIVDEPIRRLSEEDLAWGGGLLEPCCNVHRVAGHEPVARGRVPRDHFACVDACPPFNRNPALVAESLVETAQPFADLEAGAHRSQHAPLATGLRRRWHSPSHALSTVGEHHPSTG